jgi:hypothetical protein
MPSPGKLVQYNTRRDVAAMAADELLKTTFGNI